MNRFLLTPLLVCISILLSAQIPNDECDTAIDLGMAPQCPIPQIFSNGGATASDIGAQNVPTCFQGGTDVQRDVWFQFQTDPNVPSAEQNFTISAVGLGGSNGIVNPQIALYRGDCGPNGLAAWACASAPPGTSEVTLDAQGLIPGITYYIRLNDYSATGTPNAGSFRLCVAVFEPVFIMGQLARTNLCSGTLYDSGGPDGNYSHRENLTFTICPDEPHQCINFDIENFSIESRWDRLRFYSGENTQGALIADFTGSGTNLEVQAPPGCATLHFTSDESFALSGFAIAWHCSSTPCDNPITTCDDPEEIDNLPFENINRSTCTAGNSVSSSPCGDNFLRDNEYIFAYDSNGDECIQIVIENAELSTGVAVFDACPDAPVASCLGFSESTFFNPNIIVPHVFLEDAGRYYIVVANPEVCTDFDISIETINCPIILPNASQCQDALPLGGCDGDVPAVITVGQGTGDAGFVRRGVNDGCWGDIIRPNYTWFTFEAQANGEFGFIMSSEDPDEASDIDIQVWGPIDDAAQICQFAATRQPVRSTYADDNRLYDLTGLSNINTYTGNSVNDTCEDEFGDGFVKTLPVERGKHYVVLINDFNGVIFSGAISVDFAPTSPGVLTNVDGPFTVSADTAVCIGSTVQLTAAGGLAYQWLPAPGLSCRNCQSPTVMASTTTTYRVVVRGVCNSDTLSTTVSVPMVDAGSDFQLCRGETRRLSPTTLGTPQSVTWSAPAGFLNCTDCLNPIVTAPAQAGNYPVVIEIDFGNCTARDTVIVAVSDAVPPDDNLPDQILACQGDTVALGPNADTAYAYAWVDTLLQLFSTAANPIYIADSDSRFVVSVRNADCTVIDTVDVLVSEPPMVRLISDTTICTGAVVELNPGGNADFTYEWFSDDGSFSSVAVNPQVQPDDSTTYVVFVENSSACPPAEASVSVHVLNNFTLSVIPFEAEICRGESLQLDTEVSHPGGSYTWSTGAKTAAITVSPDTTAIYTVHYMDSLGCADLEVSATVVVSQGVGTIDSLSVIDINPAAIFEGDKFSIQAFLNNSDSASFSFEWFENNVPLHQSGNPLSVLAGAAGNYTYEVRITNDAGCLTTMTISISIQPAIFEIPNVFTPDGDQTNDIFRPVIKGSTNALQTMQIFNRWGKVVYQESGADAGWDGTFNSTPQPSDVYIYLIKIEDTASGRIFYEKGDVTLLR